MREIPYNYTSATDRQLLSYLLGEDTVRMLEELKELRVTGRSAKLLMRIIGEVLIYRRNPYLFQDLVDSHARKTRLFEHAFKDLDTIESSANGEQRVLSIIATLRRIFEEFRAEVDQVPEFRRRLKRELGAVVGLKNVLFDPFSIVSHATDATDWRLHLPVAVITPDDESQVAPLLAAVGRLGLKAVPRGAGTGLTGGAVPLRSDCVMINTEKLNRIRGVRDHAFELDNGEKIMAPVMEVDAGVITEKAMSYAGDLGLVFATDPTSEWSCTVGGNIAENAGGKKAVRWGTCIDNLLGWEMAMPSGERWSVSRTDHRQRKILPDDTVTYEVMDSSGKPVEQIVLRGTDIRKKGLWKDITNKALGGVPGLQKEGTDGVITSALFVLYPKYEETATLCLEFFGPDMDEASKVIVELSKRLPFSTENREALLALEHFDDEYIRAIDYKVKAARAQTPKAVLLIDIAGHSSEEVQNGVSKVEQLLDKHPNTLLFIAGDSEEAKRFWADRKKLSAIARRTNAFKLNEDVVIPLEALAEFARFVDDLNIEEERHSQISFIDAVQALLQEANTEEDGEQFAAKIAPAFDLCSTARKRLEGADIKALRALDEVETFRKEFNELFHGYPHIVSALDEAFRYVRDRRIVIATHMHAGDGNVHVNIPVLSNDQPMLKRADRVVDRVMEKVVSLGGVVSGEHGIGVTKLKYMEKERIDELTEYRKVVDPSRMMNPGKLDDFEVLDHIFTPSFNLLELEAHILKRAKIEELSKNVDFCIRCGKCKTDCCVYYPARGMFYHPRNKNLAIGSLIEALLYVAQRERSTEFELLQWLEDVADHCTICHKCLKPCPVDIDTGEVSVLERDILEARGYKHFSAITQLTLKYLESRSPLINKMFRNTVVRGGGSAMRAGNRIARPLQPDEGSSSFYPLTLLGSSVPPVPEETLRDLLPHCDPDQALVFEPDDGCGKTVFYFPGCGSERLHSTISMGAIHLLLQAGVRVVLPPPFLCCGFPAHVNAQEDQHAKIVLRNTVIFSQIREMLSYLDFDACVVSCGTCMESLNGMQTRKLFGGRIVDVMSYAVEQGLRLEGGENRLYHAPCHDSLDGKAVERLNELGGFGDVTPVEHCCSEAGTLALSRPDITDSMLQRKRAALLDAKEETGEGVILTNCPSCVQGLGRNRELGVEPRHIAVAIAEKLSGKEWKNRFKEEAAKASGVRF
uniref:FAD linked oxidase domain protein n=1 Tax=Chlorobium phaeobacteroides (strain BS1) TaxID=331678 RepID=B3EIZ5_CHLPB